LTHTNDVRERGYIAFGRTGSTSTLPCTATTHYPAAQALPHQRRAPRLLISQSLRLVARLLIIQIAPALLHLCRASGHAISLLDFWSVGQTGSRHAPDHCISRREYSLSGLHRLYCTYAVHPDTPSRRSTSRRSVALALAMCPVTASRGATTCGPDCTGSTSPMPCIRTRCLDARLLVSRSHWLSPCARSFRCAS
jgi:hypothetical protein